MEVTGNNSNSLRQRKITSIVSSGIKGIENTSSCFGGFGVTLLCGFDCIQLEEQELVYTPPNDCPNLTLCLLSLPIADRDVQMQTHSDFVYSV